MTELPVDTLSEFEKFLSEHNWPKRVYVSADDFLLIARKLPPSKRLTPLLIGASSIYPRTGPDIDLSDKSVMKNPEEAWSVERP